MTRLKPSLVAAGIAACFLSLAAAAPAAAQSSGPALGPSGLPLPRFVSLKSDRVNVREGPGETYRVAWTYVRSKLPVEITQEFDTWRRIRDADGTEGWVSQSLLSGERTAVVAPWDSRENPLPLYASPSETARVGAYLEPGVMALVDQCRDGWCRLSDDRFRGWMRQDRLWGVYPNEAIN